MATKEEEQGRNEKKDFLDLCEEGDLVSLKTLLDLNPPLIYSKNEYGKSIYFIII